MSKLHEAAIDGNLPLVRKLLKENEPIDMQGTFCNIKMSHENINNVCQRRE